MKVDLIVRFFKKTVTNLDTLNDYNIPMLM